MERTKVKQEYKKGLIIIFILLAFSLTDAVYSLWKSSKINWSSFFLALCMGGLLLSVIGVKRKK